MWLWATLQIAFAAGLATTFDDTIYLTAFFGEVSRTFRPIHVVIGELVGFTVLLTISLIGFAMGMALPASTVGLLGILPIAIGIQNLYELVRDATGGGIIAPQAETTSVTHNTKNRLQQSGFQSRRISIWDALTDRRTYDVAVVSISNGSNNLSIYIPLFASLTLSKVLVVIPVLYLFIATWLILAFTLTQMPGISLVLNRYAKLLFPFVLMWLGYRILNDSGAVALLSTWI